MSNETISDGDGQMLADGYSINQPFFEWHSHESHIPPNEQRSDTRVRNAFGSKKPNATLIYPKDVPEDYERFSKLDSQNRDNAWEYRTDVNLSQRAIYEMKRKMMDALGTQLEVGKSLISVGTRQIFRLDLSEIGLPTCAVGFCLYAHLYNEETSAYENHTPKRHWITSPGTNRPYWPFRDSNANLSPFNRVADDLIDFYSNVTEKSLQGVLQRLNQGGLPTKVGGYRPTNAELLLK